MAKAEKTGQEERFDQVMSRLEALVGKLEKGDLPLEDALKAFEEGVSLVRRGQSRLETMERRVEQLMADGSVAPLAAQGPGRGELKTSPAADSTDAPATRTDDDLPF